MEEGGSGSPYPFLEHLLIWEMTLNCQSVALLFMVLFHTTFYVTYEGDDEPVIYKMILNVQNQSSGNSTKLIRCIMPNMLSNINKLG
jgi:hypothetical protein